MRNDDDKPTMPAIPRPRSAPDDAIPFATPAAATDGEVPKESVTVNRTTDDVTAPAAYIRGAGPEVPTVTSLPDGGGRRIAWRVVLAIAGIAAVLVVAILFLAGRSDGAAETKAQPFHNVDTSGADRIRQKAL